MQRKVGYLHSSGCQRGVGLVEIMAAVFVLSIGFLAVAQMQVQAMRYSQSAYFRAQASAMLKDISDRMRSNRAGVLAGLYDNKSTAAGLLMPACVADSEACSPADLANKDLYEWSANFHPPGTLPNAIAILPGTTAQGSISLNAGVYDIKVAWSERINGADTTQQLTVQFIP